MNSINLLELWSCRYVLYQKTLESAQQQFALPANYRQRVIGDITTAVTNTAQIQKALLLTCMASTEEIIKEAIHKCDAGDCQMCNYMNEAVALRAEMKSRLDAIEDKKENMIARALKLIDEKTQAEQKLLDAAQEEKQWKAEAEQKLLTV